MSATQDPAEITRRFAHALDSEDYDAARAVLAADCRYRIRDTEHVGPDAILASYAAAGDDATDRFDEIAYDSAIRLGDDGWVVIEFSDILLHRGRRLHHRCEQWVRVGAEGRIVAIEHHDLPGEAEPLAAFKAWVAAGAPADAPPEGSEVITGTSPNPPAR